MKYCPNHQNVYTCFDDERFKYCPICRAKLVSKEFKKKYFKFIYLNDKKLKAIEVRKEYRYKNCATIIDILKIKDYSTIINELKNTDCNIKIDSINLEMDGDPLSFILRFIIINEETHFSISMRNITKLTPEELNKLITLLIENNFNFQIDECVIEYVNRMKNFINSYNKFPDFIKLQMELK